MSVNATGNPGKVNTEFHWFQNMKADSARKQESETGLSSQDDPAVKVSISREGLENCQKKLRESGGQAADGKVIEKKQALIKQAKNAVFANQYENELALRAGEWKGQREGGGTYTLFNKAEDYARAYGSLYDEIVQGYKNGTRERYVEDAASETGFRKMTMEEELGSLDKAYQKTADIESKLAENARKAAAAFKDTAGKLSKYKSVKTSFAGAYSKLDAKGLTSQENVGQKMLTLAQAWKDAYKERADIARLLW